jgi:hypothetical protein
LPQVDRSGGQVGVVECRLHSLQRRLHPAQGSGVAVAQRVQRPLEGGSRPARPPAAAARRCTCRPPAGLASDRERRPPRDAWSGQLPKRRLGSPFQLAAGVPAGAPCRPCRCSGRSRPPGPGPASAGSRPRCAGGR